MEKVVKISTVKMFNRMLFDKKWKKASLHDRLNNIKINK